MGFFFSWHQLAAQTMSSMNSVELTDTHREIEPFGDQVLEFRIGSRCMALAILQDPNEHLSAQFGRVAMAPLDECLLAFTLDTLEQPIHGRVVHGDRAASPRIGGRCSVPHLLNNPLSSNLALICYFRSWDHAHIITPSVMQGRTSHGMCIKTRRDLCADDAL